VTDGLGFFELLRLAEELGSELMMAVQDGQHAGLGGHYPPDSVYAPYVQGAVDMLEFATGGASSVWGRQRAAMGHSSPFTLHRVEIGKETAKELATLWLAA
jgi:alpha-N-arabinofuranosidase